MRVLGLDLGERRVGVALSDALGITAQPLMVLTRKGLEADLETICALITKHQVEMLVVGLPLTLRGEQGMQVQRVKSFIAALQQRITVPVHVIDERLTTVQGERALRESGVSHQKRKQVIDQVAAQLILQQFLDKQRPMSLP